MASKVVRVAVGLLVLGALALVGWIAKRQLQPDADAPDEAIRAEAALVGPDTAVLAFLDVALLARLLADSGAGAGAVDFDALLLEPTGLRGVSLASDVSRAVLALAPGPERTLVLFGRFDPDAVEAAVRARPGTSVRETAHGDQSVLSIARVDPETCEERTAAIALRADRIVVANEPSLEPLLARLDAPAQATSDGGWLRGLRGLRGLRAFEGAALLRLSVVQPAKLAELTDAPAGRAILGAFARLLDGASNARLEAHTRALGDGLAVALEVGGGDSAEIARRWDAFRAAARAEWTRVAPALASWHDALSIESGDGFARASGERGADAIRDLAALPDALVVLASRDFRGPVEPPPAAAGAEAESAAVPEPDPEAAADPAPIETDPEPVRFAAEQPLARLRAYSSDVPLAGAADVIAGPFGIRVERASRGAESGAPLELAIRAVGPLLANLPEPDASPRFAIESVVSEAGEPLLREERCGPERNGVPARLESALLSDFLEGTKTVRLVPSATLDSVVRIAGKIELELPTRAASVRVPAQFGGALEGEGVAIELTGAAPDYFAYRVTGDAERLVHVRGLDAERRPLAAREAFEVARAAGDGRIGARRYAGGLASVEAIFALETQAAVYPFALASARPSSDGEEQHVESSSFIRYTPEQFEKEFGSQVGSWPPDRRALAAASAGPFSVGIDGLDAEAGAARLSVLAPNVPNLSYHATGLEVALTGVALADGRVLAPPTDAGAHGAARVLVNARRQFGRAEVEANARVATGAAQGAGGIARLDGQLVLRLPHEVETLEFASVEPGIAVASGDARVTLFELGRDRLALRMSGPLARFFSVRAFAADGHELATVESDLPSPAAPGPHEIRFAVHGRPARLAVQLVRSHSERRYAFRIPLPGALPAAPER